MANEVTHVTCANLFLLIFCQLCFRETEWLFSTDKGRLHLQDSAGFQRLVVVTLNRGHNYEGLDAIKAELSSRVMELAPKDCPPRTQVKMFQISLDLTQKNLFEISNISTSLYFL